MGNTESDIPAEPVVREPGQEDYENAIKLLSEGNTTGAIQLLKKAIDEADNQKAITQLGLIYRDGRGVDPNPEEATRLFKGLTSDDGVGETHLGLMYLRGIGIEKNITKAISYFNEAVDKDNMDAQSHLGFLKVRGIGVDKDVEEGLRLLREASNKSAEADAYLGLMYMEGIGVNRDYSWAIEHLSKAVDRWHLDAHIYLSELLLQGKGLEKADPWKASHILLRAAKRGNSRAQCYIGIMFRDGIGVAKNIKVAKKWLQASACQGDTLGMYSLGKFLLDHENKENWVTIVDLLTKAASKGNIDGDVYDDLYIDGLSRIFKIDNI